MCAFLCERRWLILGWFHAVAHPFHVSFFGASRTAWRAAGCVEVVTNVLFIGYVWPEPRSSGAGTRTLELIDLFLREGWCVTFCTPAAATERQVDLAALGVAQKTVELNNPSFDVYVRELSPDIVVFDRFMMEEQFGWRVEEQCPRALRILDTIDLHSLRAARQQALKTALAGQDPEDAPNRVFTMSGSDLFECMAAHDLTQREVAAIYRSDLTLMISDVECDLLTAAFNVPAELLHYCSFMLDAEAMHWTAATGHDFESRRGFVSIGNFRHAPNWDAVLWLSQSIWPRVRRQLPHAHLHVYGAYAPPKAMALHRPDQGFHMLGWAPDAAEVMRAARVCLAPLRFGAGMKGKLIDAMRCGTPSVTTPIGAEAMHGGLDWCGAVKANAQDLADAAVALYTDQVLWERMRQQGQLILQQRFNKQHRGPELIARIEQCREALDTRRRHNFTGAMLRHHHHKSTRYMAQWIEAKNRPSP